MLVLESRSDRSTKLTVIIAFVSSEYTIDCVFVMMTFADTFTFFCGTRAITVHCIIRSSQKSTNG
jgi:hypothetical protein